MEDDLLTTTEVAALLHLDVRTVVRRVQAGHLHAERKLPGRTGAYLFRREAVEHARAHPPTRRGQPRTA